MWQGYVYVNDVRYSNIFTFAVGIFFVNASHVGASFVSLAPTYFISQSALMPLLPYAVNFLPMVNLDLLNHLVAHQKVGVRMKQADESLVQKKAYSS